MTHVCVVHSNRMSLQGQQVDRLMSHAWTCDICPSTFAQWYWLLSFCATGTFTRHSKFTKILSWQDYFRNIDQRNRNKISRNNSRLNTNKRGYFLADIDMKFLKYFFFSCNYVYNGNFLVRHACVGGRRHLYWKLTGSYARICVYIPGKLLA